MFRIEKNLLEDFINKKNINKDYTTEVEVPKVIKVQYKQNGRFVTNCTECTDALSCHDDCVYERDEDKKHCSAMESSGNCRHCKCHWSAHRNMTHKLVMEKEKKIINVKEMFEKWQDANAKGKEKESVIKNVEKEEKALTTIFQNTLLEIR